jgi:hypothetical protein
MNAENAEEAEIAEKRNRHQLFNKKNLSVLSP